MARGSTFEASDVVRLRCVLRLLRLHGRFKSPAVLHGVARYPTISTLFLSGYSLQLVDGSFYSLVVQYVQETVTVCHAVSRCFAESTFGCILICRIDGCSLRRFIHLLQQGRHGLLQAFDVFIFIMVFAQLLSLLGPDEGVPECLRLFLLDVFPDVFG